MATNATLQSPVITVPGFPANPVCCPRCSRSVVNFRHEYFGGRGYHSYLICAAECGFYLRDDHPSYARVHATLFGVKVEPVVAELNAKLPVVTDTNRRKPAEYKGRGRSLTERTLEILNTCGFLFVGEDEREVLFEYFPTPDTPVATHHVTAMFDENGVMVPNRCDCKDWECRRRQLKVDCKHMRALRLHVLGLTDVQVAA